MNFVGSLNTIAASYTNNEYVKKTRHMGYTNQIENCIELSSCKGDVIDRTDEDLVEAAIGSLLGREVNSVEGFYWLAGRYQNNQLD